MKAIEGIPIRYDFVRYGKILEPKENTLGLDVGMKTIPGVIDHHHPEAEAECTASLVVKHPHLVLDHVNQKTLKAETGRAETLRIITHRFPDFDAVASIFLSLRLIGSGKIDDSMRDIARYTKLVDSATLPKEVDLTATPYSILRALYKNVRKEESEANPARVEEGLKFMRFLHGKLEDGYEITENRLLFSGIGRYEKAIRTAENDYFNYLTDVQKGTQIALFLPSIDGREKKEVDGLIVKNPRSYLLKDWARRDREHAPLKDGFSFLMTSFWNKRYILGVDPEKGVYLKGLADLLNEKEAEARKAEGRLFDFPWYDGNCPFFNFRIVDSPQEGTSLSHSEIVDIVTCFGQR